MLIVDGLAANSSAGDTVILSIWGIGDNFGDTDFTATYGGNTAAEGNTQTTIYNLAGEPQLSAVGSNPFVNFTFVADGTDQIRFDIAGAGHLNAFSLAVVSVPEPSSAIVLTGVLSLLGLRRRK